MASDPPPAQPDAEVVQWQIEDSIDLHSFHPRDMLDVVESYLEAALEKGFPEVRIIHGRGKGVQRARIQKLLATHPNVAEFRSAPGSRGGMGATIVWLQAGGGKMAERCDS